MKPDKGLHDFPINNQAEIPIDHTSFCTSKARYRFQLTFLPTRECEDLDSAGSLASSDLFCDIGFPSCV